jgi:hypothetical protein
MALEHRVRQGECLASIAARHGLPSAEALFDHPDNAELKRRRKHPGVLSPGDVVKVPEREPGELSHEHERLASVEQRREAGQERGGRPGGGPLGHARRRAHHRRGGALARAGGLGCDRAAVTRAPHAWWRAR